MPRDRRLRLVAFVFCAFLPASCSDIQSSWAPRGPGAQVIVDLGNLMFVGGGLIFCLVLALTAIAILVPPSRRQWLGSTSFVFWGGFAFPMITVSALLVYGLTVAGALVRAPDEATLTIEVSGERWWWRVRYLDGSGATDFEAANQIHIPTGRNVEFRLVSPDVIHSFWVPSLAGKLDMIPGRTNSYRLTAAKAGLYRGQCAEYCGQQHALMAFDVIAMAEDDFGSWQAAQRKPAADPATAFLARGRDLFLEHGCGGCHTVRGTAATGRLGPDLTHVGSRRMIAAGSFPNNVGTLAGWVSSSQHLKPGNLMPSFDALDGVELRAIAAYMESLE
jgi:cytochrome c oxidase subunit 2